MACHSSNWYSYGVDIRLGNVRRRFLSLSSASFTVGPDGATGATGIAARASGTTTVASFLPSFEKSKPEYSVASTGFVVSGRAAPVAGSATQMCVASSVWT